MSDGLESFDGFTRKAAKEGMFNSEQQEYMRYLSSLPREAKCECGWYPKGECYNCDTKAFLRRGWEYRRYNDEPHWLVYGIPMRYNQALFALRQCQAAEEAGETPSADTFGGFLGILQQIDNPPWQNAENWIWTVFRAARDRDDFDFINRTLEGVLTSTYSVETLLYLLRATWPWRGCLPARADFYKRVEEWLNKARGPHQTAIMLKGLE